MTRINSKCLQNRRFYGVTTVLPTHVAYCCPEPRICGLFCTCSRSPASPAAAHAPPAATRPLHRRVQPAIPAVRWRLSYAPPVRGALTEDITPRACSLHVQEGRIAGCSTGRQPFGDRRHRGLARRLALGRANDGRIQPEPSRLAHLQTGGAEALR